MSDSLSDNLTIRFYRDEQDHAAIAALCNSAAQSDGAEIGRTQDEIARMMASPKAMPKENAFLFEADGQLVAFGRTAFEAGPEASHFMVSGLVHPAWRRRGIGTRVINRIEQRIQERLSESATQEVWAIGTANLKHEDRQALYEKMGYSAARYFFDMERPLTDNGALCELPAAVFPDGIRVQSMAERPDLRAVWQITNQSFRDHWGHTDMAYEQWQYWASQPEYRSDLWLLAWDVEQDVPVGLCLSGIEPEHNERVGRQDGWVFVLGVLRPYRTRGLGQALLLAGIDLLQQSGMDYAMLDVDAENLTGALGLYRRVGFYPVKESVAYRKVLRS